MSSYETDFKKKIQSSQNQVLNFKRGIITRADPSGKTSIPFLDSKEFDIKEYLLSNAPVLPKIAIQSSKSMTDITDGLDDSPRLKR